MPPRARIALAALGVCLLGGTGWLFFSKRAIEGAPAMLACLPRSSATLAYIDVSALRRGGILDALAGPASGQDPEYRRFVEGTGFDYRRDLEAAAGSFSGGDALFVLNGRFDWGRLRAYSEAQGGICRDGFCRMKANAGQRWISFYRLRQRTMSLAFSSNEYAALNAAPAKAAADVELPDAPAWALVPAAALDGANLPAGTRSFTTPLAVAEKIVLALRPAGNGTEVNLDVTCASAEAASDLLVKLEGATNMLRKLIERENQKPNPADLSGFLTAGAFRRDDRRVHGTWPLRPELIRSLTRGANN